MKDCFGSNMIFFKQQSSEVPYLTPQSNSTKQMISDGICEDDVQSPLSANITADLLSLSALANAEYNTAATHTPDFTKSAINAIPNNHNKNSTESSREADIAKTEDEKFANSKQDHEASSIHISRSGSIRIESEKESLFSPQQLLSVSSPRNSPLVANNSETTNNEARENMKSTSISFKLPSKMADIDSHANEVSQNSFHQQDDSMFDERQKYHQKAWHVKVQRLENQARAKHKQCAQTASLIRDLQQQLDTLKESSNVSSKASDPESEVESIAIQNVIRDLRTEYTQQLGQVRRLTDKVCPAIICIIQSVKIVYSSNIDSNS